jgi:hypothetical protein
MRGYCFVKTLSIIACFLALVLIGERVAAENGNGAPPDPDLRGTTARLPVATGTPEEQSPGGMADPGRVERAPRQASSLGASRDLSGWELVDVDSFLVYLAVGQACAIRFDSMGDTLGVMAPATSLTGLARQAIEYAPAWLGLELQDAFRRMDATHQDVFADIILEASDPVVDEIAFVVAHTAPEVLQSPSFHPELLAENAQYVYAHDSYLEYADILDYGSAAAGGEYYSTLVYWIASGGETLQVELPRERYYWDIVHPKITDEFPTYIDPATGAYADPPVGKFWRDFLFAYADSGYPVLRDQLAGCQTVWEGNVDSRTNGAVGIITQWILDVMDFGSGAERPIQPVRIYRKHLGRCGEHADITAAAARAALIPTNSASAMDNDHTWNEFWDRRWVAWEPVNVYVDAPWHYEGWGMQFLGAFDWRGDDWVWTVTERYTPACTLTVAVTDSVGSPIDGAQVTIARKTGSITYIESTWGSTDCSGACRFLLGDGQDVYARIDSDLGTVPPGPLYKLAAGPTVAGEHYHWNKSLANHRPELHVVPVSPPVGGWNEYRLRVVWEAESEFIYGANRIDGKTFSDHHPGGAVEFFICDDENFAAYAASDTFYAYEVAEDAHSADLVFDIPSEDGYYAVLSNQEHVASSQVVRGRAELYYLPVAGADGLGGAASSVNLEAMGSNPARGGVAISYALPADAPIELAVYDVAGRCIRILASGLTKAGEHEIAWDGTDSRGSQVSPGIYLYRLVTPETAIARKLVLMR